MFLGIVEQWRDKGMKVDLPFIRLLLVRAIGDSCTRYKRVTIIHGIVEIVEIK